VRRRKGKGPFKVDLLIASAFAYWQRLWRTPGLTRRASVTFSRRLRATAGRCTPATGRIVLSAALLDGPETRLVEVLCHEAAHLAAHLRHGRAASSHGKDWAALVVKAGFEPERRIRLPIAQSKRSAPRGRYSVLHTCPVCQTIRPAKRAVPQWRCAECVAAGLTGELIITRTERRS
jgi:predicted SprT family Zn-dependent metalloprotease